MQVKQNEEGKWCVYGADGQVLSEHDTEQAAKEAMQRMMTESTQATFLAGIDLKDLVTRDLASETEVQIAVPGHYIQQGKEFDITLKDFADAAKNFSAANNPLPVDYEHNTFVSGAEAPAAGWVKKVIDRGSQGLYAVIAWTQNAANKIRSGEYKFISPVFFFNARDTKTGAPIGTLLGPPALTNFPLIQGMMPVTAKRIDPPAGPRAGTNKKETVPMWKTFLAKLGLSTAAEEVSEERALEIVKAKMAPAAIIVAAKGILATLDLPETASEDDVKGKILALKHPGNVVSREDHDALLAKMRMQEIDNAVGDAIAAGKLTPAERDWGKKMAEENLGTFKAFIANRPKVVPIGDKLPNKKEDTGAAIDDIQAQVNKQMGVSAELFAKYNPK